MNKELLPNTTTALERNLAGTLARLSDVDLSATSALWNPDTCPVELLPWLAWADGVPEWSSSWDEQIQRDAIKAARQARRKRGTAGAMIDMLQSLGLGVQLQEWFEQTPVGAAGTFNLDVELTDRGLDQAEQESIERIVTYTKNARSHWNVMNIVITEKGPVFYAIGQQSGDETTLYPLIITDIEETMPLPMASATYDVETTTVYPLVA